MSHKDLHAKVHSSIIYCSQKKETTQLPISPWVGKTKCGVPDSQILFSDEKGTADSYMLQWMSLTYMLREARFKRPIFYDSIYITSPEKVNLNEE